MYHIDISSFVCILSNKFKENVCCYEVSQYWLGRSKQILSAINEHEGSGTELQHRKTPLLNLHKILLFFKQKVRYVPTDVSTLHLCYEIQLRYAVIKA